MLTWTRETAFFLTILPAPLADPGMIARIVRSHWRIENQLHACARHAHRALEALTTHHPQDQL